MLQTDSPTTDTSAQSFASIGIRPLKSDLDKIHDIVLAAARNGVDDMSGSEIRKRYELIYGKRIENGTVSARVKKLIDGRRLERCRFTRPCLVTGYDIHPVRVMAHQTRLAV